jgi:2-dehydropantoate 2-reductase
MTARWKKLVWNVPFNGLCVVRDTTTDTIMADSRSRYLVEKIMREVIAAADACGFSIEDAFVDEMLEMTHKMASYRPSMLLDYKKGVPLEVEAIYGAPLRAADAAGFPMPLTGKLYRQLIGK